jgi:beta-galactosidase
MKKILFSALLAFVAWGHLAAQLSNRGNFDNDWKFYLGEVKAAEQGNFDDQSWRSLDLPHDWSIEGEFSAKAPATNAGGSLPGGIGWYRKKFTITKEALQDKFFIEFDGVYMNSSVWINGHLLGTRPYGYASFQYDLTPYLVAGENTLAVKVDNSKQPNSRWYSGSGIYRHVWLIEANQIHFAQYGAYITTEVKGEEGPAIVTVSNTVKNETSTKADVELHIDIYDKDGKLISSARQILSAGANSDTTFKNNLVVDGPHLWSPEKPYLYKVVCELYSNNKLLQSDANNLGMRYFKFDSDKGFSLNGKPLKILGVCEHHDLGCLGSALNDRALERQLQILKAMGCNAIRTSHNPPAPELLDLCDRLGFLVMDEAFDCWHWGKNKYDFHKYFAKWHETELRDMVMRDRNHPCIILWSIGNEIPEQASPTGGKTARELVSIVKRYHPSALTTSALSAVQLADVNGYAAALDVVGINYSVAQYDNQKKKYPERKYIASETTSAVASRGVYHGPASERIYQAPDMQCSAYDNCWVPWGLSAEAAWREVKKRDFMSGMFVWTGFDYIGEPTPYKYPAVSSYFGIIDLCGFPKDPYYFYQSQWTRDPVLHLLPHWNWHTGDSVDVLAFTNCDSVRLSLNDKPIGTRSFANTDKMHLAWKVAFTPGTLKAEGYRNGVLVKTDEVKTAGAPAHLEVTEDVKSIKADGKDLCFVTVKVTDANGVMVPNADNLIHFDISGEGKIAGVDNGNSISLEPHKANQRKAFNGMCLAVIQSTGKKGNIKLQVSGEGLAMHVLNIQAK